MCGYLFKYILDPVNGLIKNDSVTFEVDVHADPPSGVGYVFKKSLLILCGFLYQKMFLVQNALLIIFSYTW